MKTAIAVAVMTSFIILPDYSHAVDYLYMGIKQDFIMDTNPSMTSDNDKTIYGTKSSASIALDKILPTKSFMVSAAVIQNIFNDGSYNSTDYTAKSRYTKKTQTAMMDLKASITHDTTRDIEDTDFGLITREGRRLTWAVAPRLQFDLSPMTSLFLQSEWRQRYFENAALLDYRTINIATGANYKLSQKNTVTTGIKLRRFDTLNARQETNTIGPYLGIRYDVNPRIVINSQVGFVTTHYSGYSDNDNGWHNNPVYNIFLNYKGNRAFTNLNLIRSREAFANGQDYDLTTIGLTHNYDLNDRLSLHTDAAYKFVGRDSRGASDLNSIWDGGLALHYQPWRQWMASLSHRYRYEKLQDGQDAARNIIRIALHRHFGDDPDRSEH